MVAVVKRRPVEITVSDHAVLRWLERAQGLDIAAIRRLIAGLTVNAAELEAVAVQVGKVRFVLRNETGAAAVPARVVVTTVLRLDQRRGLGGGDG